MSGRRATECCRTTSECVVFVNESLACDESLVIFLVSRMGSRWKKVSRGGEGLAILAAEARLALCFVASANYGPGVGQQASGMGSPSKWCEQRAGVVSRCGKGSQMEQGRLACHWMQGTAGRGSSGCRRLQV